MLLVIWVLTIFGMRISGAHYNPCISIAYILKRDTGSFPRVLGIGYAVMQILGAFLGAIISWFLIGGYAGLIDDTPISSIYKIPTASIMKYMVSDSGSIYPSCTWKETDLSNALPKYEYNCSYAGFVFGAMIAEALGSFFVAFFYLSQMEQ